MENNKSEQPLLVDKVQYQAYYVVSICSTVMFGGSFFLLTSIISNRALLVSFAVFFLLIIIGLCTQPRIRPIKIYKEGILTAGQEWFSLKQRLVKFEDIASIEYRQMKINSRYGATASREDLFLKDVEGKNYVSALASPRKFFNGIGKLVALGKIEREKLKEGAGWEKLLDLNE